MPDLLPLSPRLRATDAPPIPAARAWAARYAGGAGPLIDLTQAVPGYPPHPDMLARLAEAAGSRAAAGYGPIDGDPALREALAADAAAVYGAEIGAADVAITAGCNIAFSMAMAVAAGGAGAGVILPTPWYFNHRMALEMQGIPAIPLPCRAEDGFLPDPDRLAPLLAAGARALVLVTPNNPTGAVCPPALIEACAALCRRHGAWLVLDETYRDFLPAGGPPHALFQDPGWRDGVVHLYSFSKAYCVPGHRVGAILAGPAFRTELLKALDTWQICPPRAAQAALAWAVPALADWRAANRDLMAERAAGFRAAVAQLPGWRLDALGAYFAYLRVPEDGPDAMAVAEHLAARRGLLGLPGPFFGPGQERHLRLAFANAAMEAIAQVPARLAH
ncbi:aminotransferase [Paracraurococcus ruber]|uniref:aspartate transaminase n=1 Tax=Paracraurococcus ruber TaxID=77675 RepID=A0ABS1D642_9PROT|nr:aminotransferase [Paracraurococcus ruber]MBK1662264.1 aspartate/tyrosine/aromatic aminotransferase [Paracraurococcus ruber]TDG26902.1 aminotransferase [Paracraurococcus ruber]